MSSDSSSTISNKAHDVGPNSGSNDSLSYRKGPAIEMTERRKINDDAAFASDVDSRHHKPAPGYEGLHRWDPEFEWTEEEEKKIVQKIDLRVFAFCALTFFALQLDRGNLTQALSDNMLDDLKLSTNDYNTGQTIFFLVFLFAEMPSQLVSKKIGAERWIPVQMVCWSLVASCQAFLSGKSSYFACRALLGFFEGGFIPDTILFLSYWYTSKELPRRLSLYWTAYAMTSVIGAFMAFGFLHVHINGYAGWRCLFAFEGLITGVVGLIAGLYLPSSPTQTKTLLSRNGWFNEREEKIMVNRVLRDDPGKGDMHNRQALSPKLLLKAFSDFDLLPIYIIGLTWGLPTSPSQQYITLQLKSLGFDTFQTSLLTIPAYVLFIIQLIWWTWVAERTNQRMLVGVFAEVYNLACCIALRVLPDDASHWARWVLSTLLVGSPYIHAEIVSVTSRNAGSVRTRTVATAMYNMTVQASSIIGTNIYRADDAPFYRRGNSALIGLSAMNILLFLGAKYYYMWRNSVHERKWNTMTTEQKDIYIEANRDKGNKRYDFRFIY